MIALDSADASALLALHLGCPAGELKLTPLGGGVSNLVYLIETATIRCVAKQALGKLRVEQDWFCSPHRIHREAAAMRALGPVLPAGSISALLFEDFENGIICMEAAPADALPWKDLLMRGEFDERPARETGLLHAAWIRESAGRPEWGEEFGGVQTFIDLRVDPYFRSTAARHPDLAGHFASLERECLQRRISLVHGDLSPKNLLVTKRTVTLIDHEVIHWGDPAFDAAFLTNHLIIKAFYHGNQTPRLLALARAYWGALLAGVGPALSWIEPAAMAYLGGLMLARVDGKSPAEYLDENMRVVVRNRARALLASPPPDCEEAFERCFKS
jgi:5-methylthioribose kinase